MEERRNKRLTSSFVTIETQSILLHLVDWCNPNDPLFLAGEDSLKSDRITLINKIADENINLRVSRPKAIKSLFPIYSQLIVFLSFT